ncbi:alkaline phosphatase family protein, partial [Escherichia coli]|nr:alkaline phosphatase family protein [Escherichia coli]
LPRASRVCLVLVDGLGAENLAARIGHAPTLRALTAREPLTSTAPSTTAAALTTLGTGALPGRTSMLSYSLRSPRTGRNFSLISWEDSGLNPEEWQPVPT